MMLTFKNSKKKSKGYLSNLINWNKKFAEKIAKEESIKMTKKHWEIIFFIRNFYDHFNETPSMRMLSKAVIKKNDNKNTSTFLFKLFPKGPVKQASKIAGVPFPHSCF